MDALFSTTIKAGDRTYFIDMREAKNKSKYLTISESKRARNGDGKGYSKSSVMVFDDQLEKFRGAIDEAMKVIVK